MPIIKAPILIAYVVQGYHSMSDTGALKDFVEVKVFALNEKEALSKAKKLISKKNYRVSSVEEFYYDLRINGVEEINAAGS